MSVLQNKAVQSILAGLATALVAGALLFAAAYSGSFRTPKEEMTEKIEALLRKSDDAAKRCAAGSQFHCDEASSARIQAGVILGLRRETLRVAEYNRLSAWKDKR